MLKRFWERLLHTHTERELPLSSQRPPVSRLIRSFNLNEGEQLELKNLSSNRVTIVVVVSVSLAHGHAIAVPLTSWLLHSQDRALPLKTINFQEWGIEPYRGQDGAEMWRTDQVATRSHKQLLRESEVQELLDFVRSYVSS